VPKGVVQDTSFITADPDQASCEHRGEGAQTRPRMGRRLCEEEERIRLRLQVPKTDTDHGLIRDLKTASAPESRVDFSQHGEVVYRDRATSESGPEGTLLP